MTKYTCSAPGLSQDQNLNISRTAPVWWQPGEIRGAHCFVRAKPSAPEIWTDVLASNKPSAFPVLVLCKRDRFSSWEAKGTSYEQPCVMTKLCSGLLRGRLWLLRALWGKQDFFWLKATLSLVLTWCDIRAWWLCATGGVWASLVHPWDVGALRKAPDL